MAEIMDGKSLSLKILDDIKEKTALLKKRPGLSVILIGNNPASSIYVKNKEKQALNAGFNSIVYKLPETASKGELLSLINNLNNDEDIDGILLQLPLPKHLNPYDFFWIKSTLKKDVDGFHPVNAGKLLLNENPYAVPCTPKGYYKAF